MDINSINADTSRVSLQSGTRGSSELGQQQFLQLLVAQLRNQDPINPLDGAEFAAQLAQFNSVEQLVNVNEGINMLAKAQEGLAVGLTNTMAASLAGKHVKAISNEINLSGQASEINFNLKSAASDVEVVIRDQDGNAVRRVNLTNLPQGDQGWQWDGRNDNGNRVPEGNYFVEISAKDGNTNVAAYAFIEGIAERVRYSSSGVDLLVNGVFVNLGDIEEIGEVPQNQENGSVLERFLSLDNNL